MSFLETSGGWKDQASCRELPMQISPNVFIEPKSEDELAKAAKICGSCVVRQACHDTARTLPPEEIEGQVWAGQLMQRINF